MAEDNPLFNYP